MHLLYALSYSLSEVLSRMRSRVDIHTDKHMRKVQSDYRASRPCCTRAASKKRFPVIPFQYYIPSIKETFSERYPGFLVLDVTILAACSNLLVHK